MQENTRVVAFEGTPLRVKSPSELVTVPTVVPLTKMETPGRGLPSSSKVTLPRTVEGACAKATPAITSKLARKRMNLFIGKVLS
jgi:hypothetical protein